MDSRPQEEKQKSQEQRSLSLSEAQIKETALEVSEVLKELKSLFDKQAKTAALEVSEVRKEIKAISVRETFSGPYPHPKHVPEYEKYCPGFLKRIVSLSEKEQADLTATDKRRDHHDFIIKIASLSIVSLFALGAFYLILNGKDTQGLVVILTAASAFISKVWIDRNKNRQGKT